MDDLVKFKCEFFDIFVKCFIRDIVIAKDKALPEFYGYINWNLTNEIGRDKTSFTYFIDNIFIVKDGKKYVPEQDDNYLFECDQFLHYCFWLNEENVKLKDGLYYKNTLVTEKLKVEGQKISNENFKAIVDERNKEYEEYEEWKKGRKNKNNDCSELDETIKKNIEERDRKFEEWLKK